MPRRCSICTHGELEAIDTALVDGEPYRNIAAQFGISTSALQRHKRTHIPQSLMKAVVAEELMRADDLLAHVSELRKRALSILEEAEREGDLRSALLAIREARGCIELLAKLVGELKTGTEINVVANNPVWISLRSEILRTLGPFPEAREAVSNALLEAPDAR
jgi:hypothetical protein